MSHIKNLSIVLLITGTAVALVPFTSSCGKPAAEEEELDPSASNSNGYLNVNGVAGFGSHCPQGSITPVKPVRLQLWNCPIGSGTVTLNDPIKPIYFQVDCKNRLISARTQDKSIDTTWNMMPDNSFYFTLDGKNSQTVQLRSDGNIGEANCNVALSSDYFGTVDCTDPDAAKIHFEAVMWANRPQVTTPRPSPVVTQQPGPFPSLEPAPPVASSVPVASPSPAPSSHSRFPWWPFTEAVSVAAVEPSPTPAMANMCHMPQTCYFYTTTEITQCR